MRADRLDHPPVLDAQPIGTWPLALVWVEISAVIVVWMLVAIGHLEMLGLALIVLTVYGGGVLSIIGVLWAVLTILVLRDVSNPSRTPAYMAIFLQCALCAPYFYVTHRFLMGLHLYLVSITQACAMSMAIATRSGSSLFLA